MVEWSKLCREASNREGHLDVKFLNARYNKGLKQVQDFMEANHKYFETSIGLQDAQAEILKFQRKFDNGNGQLDRFKSIWVFKTRPNPLRFTVLQLLVVSYVFSKGSVTLRQMLLIFDCSSWPGRS